MPEAVPETLETDSNKLDVLLTTNLIYRTPDGSPEDDTLLGMRAPSRIETWNKQFPSPANRRGILAGLEPTGQKAMDRPCPRMK